MHKKLLLICALIFTIVLSVCGKQEEVSTVVVSTETTTKATEEIPPATESYSFELDEKTMTSIDWNDMVIQQSNRHGMNTFAYDNSWIYGSWGGTKGTGEVVKVRYDNSDWTVIDNDTNTKLAPCQAVKNGYIYYSQYVDGIYELIKVRASGEEAKVIISEHNGSIQIVGDYIYYTTKEVWKEDGSGVTEDSSHLYRCNLDGENIEKLLEKPVYYFTVFGEKILYQDDKDGMTAHLYDMSPNVDHQINDKRTFWPIYDGKYIYYLTDDEEPDSLKHKLWRMKIDGSEDKEINVGSYLEGLLIREDYIYYVNKDDSSRIYRCLKDGSNVELITQDSNVYKMQWVKNSLAYMCLDEEGYIEGVYLCDYDGGDRIEFCNSDEYWYLD